MNAQSSIRASLWMIGAIVAFTSMAIAGRAAILELDTFEIMLFRSLIGLAIVLVVAKFAGTLGDVQTARLGLHVVRNASHFMGQNLWFFAISVAPLAHIFAMEFTSPIWSMFLATIILGEALTKMRVGSALVGFVGVLIVTQPWQIDISVGVIAGAIAAIGFAGSAVTTRLLTRHEKITSIMFWLTSMQCVFGLICAGFDGDIALPSLAALPWVIVIALAGLLAHFCLTKALSLAPAAVVMPVDFARLPIIALVGLWLYGESLEPLVLVGAAIIFAANYVLIRHEHRQSRAT